MKTTSIAIMSALIALPAAAQEHNHAHHMPAPPAAADTPADPHAGHQMSGIDAAGQARIAPVRGALGGYLMTRDASGTSWQPDTSVHGGLHSHHGAWQVMTHATLNAVWDKQGGRRGDDKAFVSGMLMASAARDLGAADRLTLRAMLSPDPLMGKRGYPLLLASGETADGQTPLVDRQHPHELFMELSATWSHRLGERASVFLYGGLPGEPAFGPPAFMHRMAIMDSPEAPISHHWLDSTHITMGVVTAGVVAGDWKLEASRFRGREPDQHRYDIERPKLDSTAVRVSWNPGSEWSLQASFADAKSPEQLAPDDDAKKWSASAIYTRDLGAGRWWSTTAAFGRRSADHGQLDAWVLESAIKPHPAWTVFARAERTDTNELLSGAGHHGPTFTVAKASVGAIRDFRVADQVSIGLGGLVSVNDIPSGLKPSYGGSPKGGMAFLRLKVG